MMDSSTYQYIANPQVSDNTALSFLVFLVVFRKSIKIWRNHPILLIETIHCKIVFLYNHVDQFTTIVIVDGENMVDIKFCNWSICPCLRWVLFWSYYSIVPLSETVKHRKKLPPLSKSSIPDSLNQLSRCVDNIKPSLFTSLSFSLYLEYIHVVHLSNVSCFHVYQPSRLKWWFYKKYQFVWDVFLKFKFHPLSRCWQHQGMSDGANDSHLFDSSRRSICHLTFANFSMFH